MNAAPAASYGPKKGGSYSAQARERHTPSVPDWIAQLAMQADLDGNQGVTGKRLGVSASTVSALIGNTYRGRIDVMEALVKGKLMNATVSCPVMGEIARDECMRLQKLPFSAANPQRAKLHGACRGGCTNALGGKS